MQKQTIASFDATNQWFAAALMLLSVTESVITGTKSLFHPTAFKI